ncbi:MAG: hypothetical protein JWM68_1512, partial [Verrucomicrobiales bacterium]|nr:hypothetical protein [Verrucomicrobiales bacterium]
SHLKRASVLGLRLPSGAWAGRKIIEVGRFKP